MAAVTVVGGGWAGLAAAVRAVEAGHRVTLVEMAPHAGGRARTVEHDDHVGLAAGRSREVHAGG